MLLFTEINIINNKNNNDYETIMYYITNKKRFFELKGVKLINSLNPSWEILDKLLSDGFLFLEIISSKKIIDNKSYFKELILKKSNEYLYYAIEMNDKDKLNKFNTQFKKRINKLFPNTY